MDMLLCGLVRLDEAMHYREQSAVRAQPTQVHFLAKYCAARGMLEPDVHFFAECIRIINIFAMVRRLPRLLLPRAPFFR
jgi:hypothetical protein